MKGAAIIAVVLLHVLSSLPGHIFTSASYAPVSIFLDQFGRLSVPVFLGLSGYALTRRYEDQWSWTHFYQRRVLRLIPLYLLWSLTFWQLFRHIPVWYTSDTPMTWWQVVFLGHGDYHLYFVPLIFQFYFIFPLLLAGIKKIPWFVWGLSLLLQGMVLVYFQGRQPGMWWGTDQAQYSILLSWLGYVSTGMVLGQKNWFAKKISLTPFLGIWLGSLIVMTTQAVWRIQHGVDPLEALRFTRLVVVPYGLASIFLAIRLPWEKLAAQLPKMLGSVWLQVGRWSFVIYLSHTLALRILFAPRFAAITPENIVLAGGVLTVGIILSVFLERK